MKTKDVELLRCRECGVRPTIRRSQFGIRVTCGCEAARKLLDYLLPDSANRGIVHLCKIYTEKWNALNFLNNPYYRDEEVVI